LFEKEKKEVKKKSTMASTPASAALYHSHDDWEEPDRGNKSPVLYVHQHRRNLSPQNRQTCGVLHEKALIRTWFNTVASVTVCVDQKNQHRASKCSCLMEAATYADGEGIASIVDYLYEFALLELEEQRIILKEWIKYSESAQMMLKRADRRRVYLLPGSAFLICKDALCKLLGMGHTAWTTITKIARENLPPSHGLKGQVGNRRDLQLEDTVSTFLSKLNELAIPRATMVIRQLVRGTVQTELRDDDDDIRELPSHFTRKGMFNQLLNELGWQYHYDAKGRITERVALPDIEQKRTPSWFMFFRYWKKKYPKLVVATAREDICNQCFVYANQHKYFTARKDDAADEDEEQPLDDQGPPEDDDDEDDEDGVQKMLDGETLVRKAARHVEMAQLQRYMYQRKKKEAKDTMNEPPSNRVLTYVADYAQNMYLPNFASEQPGATYYYSPLSAFCFGIVDGDVDTLTAWVYTEEDAKKGGNNVASLMMHHLHHKGIIQQAATEPFKEINFVMDNCCGQKQNRHVLRLLHIMVKRGITKLARCIFLVKGHTKNDCDRLFNTMKKEYRKTNCYTKEALIKAINHDKVEALMVPPETFRNWDALQNKYMSLPTGKVTSNHVFTVDINRNNGNSMAFQECDDSVVTEKTMIKRAYFDNDSTFWNEQQATLIPTVGLQDIKWIEMHDKWGRYIPMEEKTKWRYYNEKPPPEVYARVKKQSKGSKQQRQSRTRTDHDERKKPPKADQDASKKPPKKAKTKSPTEDPTRTGAL
jgi:hypothetical protein